MCVKSLVYIHCTVHRENITWCKPETWLFPQTLEWSCDSFPDKGPNDPSLKNAPGAISFLRRFKHLKYWWNVQSRAHDEKVGKLRKVRKDKNVGIWQKYCGILLMIFFNEYLDELELNCWLVKDHTHTHTHTHTDIATFEERTRSHGCVLQ